MKRLFALSLILLLWLGCSDSDNLVIVLLDELSAEAGEYSMIWDQRFENGGPVPEGTYRVDMETDNFDACLYFEITPFDNLQPFTKTLSGGISQKPIPDSYGLRIDKTTFYPGEPIGINYDLPQTDRIRLTITWINFNISPL